MDLPTGGDKSLIQDAYRDFAIVCNNRSGSHLLATSLDSHPEICCQGDLLQAIGAPHKPYAARPRPSYGIRGAIIMYGRWRLARRLDLAPRKFIHLLRNPSTTAISVARNEDNLRRRGDAHRPHAPRGSDEMQIEDFDTTDLPVIAARIAKRQEQFSAELAGYTVLEVRYEDLTRDKDVQELPAEVSSRMLEFLGVSRSNVTLAPSIKKTS